MMDLTKSTCMCGRWIPIPPIPFVFNTPYSLFTLFSYAHPVRGHLSVSLPPLSSPTLPLFICIPPPSPLYHLQGPHLKLMTSMPDSVMTFWRLTHQESTTSNPLHRPDPNGTGQAADTPGQACVTPWHPLPPCGHLYMGGPGILRAFSLDFPWLCKCCVLVLP
jgi:hypothetical protein